MATTSINSVNYIFGSIISGGNLAVIQIPSNTGPDAGSQSLDFGTISNIGTVVGSGLGFLDSLLYGASVFGGAGGFYAGTFVTSVLSKTSIVINIDLDAANFAIGVASGDPTKAIDSSLGFIFGMASGFAGASIGEFFDGSTGGVTGFTLGYSGGSLFGNLLPQLYTDRSIMLPEYQGNNFVTGPNGEVLIAPLADASFSVPTFAFNSTNQYFMYPLDNSEIIGRINIQNQQLDQIGLALNEGIDTNESHQINQFGLYLDSTVAIEAQASSDFNIGENLSSSNTLPSLTAFPASSSGDAISLPDTGLNPVGGVNDVPLLVQTSYDAGSISPIENQNQQINQLGPVPDLEANEFQQTEQFGLSQDSAAVTQANAGIGVEAGEGLPSSDTLPSLAAFPDAAQGGIGSGLQDNGFNPIGSAGNIPTFAATLLPTTAVDIGMSGNNGDGGNDGGGGGGSSGSFGSFGSFGSSPVVLDLTGHGIKITQLTSSSQFFDVNSDGTEHLSAWAGAGNAVLFYDPTGQGVLTRADQMIFTDLDPGATNDLQALEDVFDTNHDGSLDSSDAAYSDFFLKVTNANGTTSVESLAQAGVASINLTANNYTQDLPDGSAIDGETTYTTTSGTTGTAAAATFAVDPNGYDVTTTDTTNSDGSTTIENLASNPQGGEAFEQLLNTSANGLAKTLSVLNSGGTVEAIQTDDTVTNSTGSVETLTNYRGGTILAPSSMPRRRGRKTKAVSSSGRIARNGFPHRTGRTMERGSVSLPDPRDHRNAWAGDDAARVFGGANP